MEQQGPGGLERCRCWCGWSEIGITHHGCGAAGAPSGLRSHLLLPWAQMSGRGGAGQIRYESQHLDRGLEQLEGAVIGEQCIAVPEHRGSQMDRICYLQPGGGQQLRRPLHHFWMQGHHAAVGEEAAERQQADLIGHAQWPHQPFLAHQITDHPVGSGIALQLLQGVAPQTLSPHQGIDQHTGIEVEPHPSPPGGPLQLQC